MKLYSCEVDGRICLGTDYDGRLINLNRAFDAMKSAGLEAFKLEHWPSDMLTLLRLGQPAIEAAHRAAEFVASKANRSDSTALTHEWSDVRVLAPVPRPGKILCAGVNFKSHMLENPNAKLPDSPRIFAKMPSVVIGTGDPIVYPRLTQKLDYEVELAAIIGRKMRNVSEKDALDYVAGYTILNDVSARDVQSKDNQITLGKNFETFAPMGPCMTTSDEFTQPGKAHLRTFVNGELRQDGSTTDWIFTLEELLSFLSQIMLLEPGDVVSTGTPAGVGLFRKPPFFLQPNDLITLEIAGIGRIENRVVAEESK